MGIRFTCPNGHKLHVKAFLAGKRGVCPQCGAKITIPDAQEPQSIEITAPTEVGRRSGDGGIFPQTGVPTEVGSQSIIIAIADAPAKATPQSPTPLEIAQSGPGLIEPLAPAVALHTVSRSEASPLVVAETPSPVSPAVRYFAQRERNRRNQFTIAVVLLLAVIVLAGVLIWVLQRGTAAPAVETKSQQVSSFDSSRPSWAVRSISRCRKSQIEQVVFS